MGMIRKTMSLGTAGLVDFRSDKERTAAYTRGARKHARRQTKIMKAQAAQQQQHNLAMQGRAALAPQPAARPAVWPPIQPVAAPAPPMTHPAGWYPDQVNPALVRWFDGARWTEQTQPVRP